MIMTKRMYLKIMERIKKGSVQFETRPALTAPPFLDANRKLLAILIWTDPMAETTKTFVILISTLTA